MTVSPLFSGAALIFSVTGPGVVIDPVTGALTIPTDVLLDGVEVAVVARNSAGAVSQRFRVTVTVTAEAVAPAPGLVTPPALRGTGVIGTPVEVTPGVWSPAEAELSLQWRRDGADIPGAVSEVYVPAAEDDGWELTCAVVAVTEAGRLEAVTPPLRITQAPPVATGGLGDLTLTQGEAPRVVAAGADFAGGGLVFSVAGAGAVIDPVTGVLTLSTDALLWEEPVVVTAVNSGGAASRLFRVSVAAAPVDVVVTAPSAVGALPAVVFELGAGARTISSQAGFAGADLVYELVAAPAGVTIHPGSGLVRIPANAPLAAETVTVRARNSAGRAEQSFTLTVRSSVTVFDGPEKLAEVTYLDDVDPPVWAYVPEGFARLTPWSKGRVHGLWSKAAGDGLYRCLVRWSAPLTDQTGARPFSFSVRLGRTGTNFTGLRLDAMQPVAGRRDLQIHQYTGVAGNSALVARATVGWDWNVWAWVELELDGGRARGRIYPEAAEPPAWQLTVQTTHSAPGGFGPGGFPRYSQSPDIDIRRLEFHPLGVVPENVPPAALDADWSLGQFTEQK